MSAGISRATTVWAQTILITVPMAILLLATGLAKPAIGDLLRSVLPFSTRAYWFVTTFVCFRLLLPILNRSVAVLSVRTLTYISMALLIIYSVFPMFFEVFGWNDVQHGYSLAWFVTLYYCTAVLVKSDLINKIPLWASIGGYVFCSLALFASVVVLEKLGNFGFAGREDYIIRNYSSIPVFLQGFSLFLAFSRIRSEKEGLQKAMSILASGSLMSYVIHMHPLVKQILGRVEIRDFYPTSIVLYVLYCIAVSIAVYLVGVLCYRALRVPVKFLSDKIAYMIGALLAKGLKRFSK